MEKFSPALFETEHSRGSRMSAQTARQQRYSLRSWLRVNGGVERTARCGQGTVDGTVRLNVGRSATGRRVAGASGLITCGSPWACPVCSAKVAASRQVDVLSAFERLRASGSGVVFVTFTLRHSADMTLDHVWDGLADAWRGLVSGKGWVNLRERYGLLGFIRAVEVTHGKNGWHVHCHTALALEPGSDPDLRNLETELYVRWENSLARFGFSAERQYGIDVTRGFSDSGLARYMSKNGLAAEITQGSTKKSRTPFAILAELQKSGQIQCDCWNTRQCNICLWREWEKSSSGRRQLTWSRNLTSFISETPVDTESDTYMTERVEVLRVFSIGWRVIDSVPGRVADLFSILETLGILAACQQLDDWGVHWELPPVLPPIDYYEKEYVA
jgi:hypothetical protein